MAENEEKKEEKNKEKDWRVVDVEKTKEKFEKWRKILFPLACAAPVPFLIPFFICFWKAFPLFLFLVAGFATSFYITYSSWKRIGKLRKKFIGSPLKLFLGCMVFLFFWVALYLCYRKIFWFWLPATILVFPWYSTHCFKIVKAWENGVVFFFGKVREDAKDPGPRWVWWPAEIMKFVKMYQRKIDIPLQRVILCEKHISTATGVVKPEKSLIAVDIDPVFWFKVTNAVKSLTRIENIEDALTQLFIVILRNECAQYDLQTLISEREKISEKIQELTAKQVGEKKLEEPRQDKETKEPKKVEEKKEKEEEPLDWGVKIVKAGLQDVKPPDEIMKVLHGIYMADKNRKATIIIADAEQQRILRVFSTTYNNDPERIIRPLEALEKFSKGKGSTIIMGGIKGFLKNLLAAD